MEIPVYLVTNENGRWGVRALAGSFMVVGTLSVAGGFHSRRVVVIALLLLSLAALACAPEPDGAVVFTEYCASCHLDPLFPRAPHLAMMQGWNPAVILTALSSGLMEEQGRSRGARERTAVAEHISLGVADADPDRRRIEEPETLVP